jgi:hypothetical protein
MTSPPSTSRSARSSERLRDAVAQPLNVLVPVALVVAAVLTGAAWLLLVAAVAWTALVALSYREAPVAGPPAPDLAPAIAARVRAAEAARDGIGAAVAASSAPLDGVTAEVDELLRAIRANAERAQRIHAFLAERPAAQPDVLDRVRERLDELLAEVDHAVGTLQTVRGEILTAEDDDPAGLAPSLAAQVSELRVRAGILSRGLDASLAQTGVNRDTEGP